MNWDRAYILVRPEVGGRLRVVHACNKLKDARYWLTYIAQPGDALFQTPLNPKYLGKDGRPVYQAHLVKRGKVAYSEKAWLDVHPVDLQSAEFVSASTN